MRTKNILIVGDWFIDEYWFLARQNSETSSHTGPVHYRIFSDMHEPVRGLCGAGLVTRVLHELDVGKNNHLSLCGIGVWNESDTEYLRHLIHAPKNNEEANITDDAFCHSTCAPFIVCIEQKIKETKSDVVPASIKLTTLDKDSATVRVIRQYHICGNDFRQVNRIDWAPEQNSDDEKLTTNHKALPDNVDAIVIDDHKKGVITDKVINFICKKYENKSLAKYVRTKNKDVITDESPKWFKQLSRINLLVLGPEVCSRYTPPGRILTGSGQITRDVYDLLNHFRRGGKQPQCENIVLVSDKLELVALLGDKCFATKAARAITDTDLEGVGFTTSLFASLIHAMETDTPPRPEGNPDEKIRMRLEELIDRAYDKAHVPTPKSLGSAPKQDRQSSHRTGPKGEVSSLGAWTKISQDWRSAVEYEQEERKRSMGIIKKKVPKKGQP